MKYITLKLLLTMAFLFGNAYAVAQTSPATDASCNPSAQEILSAMETFYKLSPSEEGLVIGGAIPKAARRLRGNAEYITLLMALTMIGGISQTSEGWVYIIRKSPPGEGPIKIEVNFRDIKKALKVDVLLQRGDAVFVAETCKDGKLLPSGEPKFVKPVPWESYSIVPNRGRIIGL